MVFLIILFPLVIRDEKQIILQFMILLHYLSRGCNKSGIKIIIDKGSRNTDKYFKAK